MSGTIEMPGDAAAATTALPAGTREANIASQANRVTALVGVSGGGKSSLADTAAEYGFERYGCTTLCYAIDPGGFGNKRLALIRAGIMSVYDPRNHVNFFEAMDAISLGAWPEKIEDPERGYADPYVKLIMPRRLSYDVVCPQGHVAKRFESTAVLQAMIAATFPCETCSMVITQTNLVRIDKSIVKDRRFKKVGLRIYDSLSAMSDQGLILELPSLSAKGQLVQSEKGRGVLGSADALRQGDAVYGSGSEAQVGFMQNRAYGWLMNIRQIPDQVMPPIVTFGVEESKPDTAAGGVMITGPRIAGKARTSAVPGWVGDLLFASHEPEGIPRGSTDGNMVFRLYLTTHVDPRDTKRLPILAKHRGTPLGMPDYLEDPWYPTKDEREAHAWEQCSLKVFYQLLEAQQQKLVDDLRARFPNAPAWTETKEDAAVDEVIGIAASPTAAAAGAGTVAVVPQATVGGGRTLGRGRRLQATAVPTVPAGNAPPVGAGAATDAAPAASAPTVTPAASSPRPQVSEAPVAVVTEPTGSGTGSGAPGQSASIPAPAVASSSPALKGEAVVPEPKSVLQQQLEDSLKVRTGADAGGAVTVAQGSPGGVQPTVAASQAAVTQPTPAPTPSIAPSTSGPRVIRRPRPPV